MRRSPPGSDAALLRPSRRARGLSALAVSALVAACSPAGERSAPVPPPPDPQAGHLPAAGPRASDGGVATSSASSPVSVTYRAMGTQIAFTAWTDEPARARGAFEAAIGEIRRLESLHSNWIPNSDVSRINARAGEAPVEVAPETIELMQAARRVHDASRGKFDVTFGALADLWRFDHDQDNVVPEAAALQARLRLVDGAAVLVDPGRRTVFLPKRGMRVHVGGIGKGYAVDAAVTLLRARGLRDFLVQAGGDLYASGRRGDRPWRVGIRDPRGPSDAFFAFADVENQTFSTSGDYERFFVKDGRRYHHILDPDLGVPSAGVRSVTILAPSALWADGLSTAVFILGPSDGMRLVESLDGVGAVIVDDAARVHVSKRLEGRVRVVRPPSR